jgi:predicted RNase H-like HicB family nuclease
MTAGSDARDNGKIKPLCSMPRWIISTGMKHFTAIVHRGDPAEGGFWATCLEVPGANGQGETKEECLGNLKEAIQLLLDTEREEVFRLDPQAETTELVLA